MRHTLCVLATLILVGFVPDVLARPVVLSWDPSPEPIVVGYIVQLGIDPGRLEWEIDVGARTAWVFPSLPAPTRVYFRVIAYTAAGVRSAPSATVFADPHGTDDASPPDELATWRAWHRLSADDGDDDGDGVSNLEEFRRGTNPRLPNRWFFGEGATGVFSMRLALANPGHATARARVTFLGSEGPLGDELVEVPPWSRRTIRVNELPGMARHAMSAVVATDAGGVVAERTMSWGQMGLAGLGRAGHTGRPVGGVSRAWLFAEGASGLFETYLLVVNPGTSPATIDVAFDDDGGQTARRRYEMAPASRLTVLASAIPELRGRSFSTRLVSSVPVSAERAMYFGERDGLWRGGHVSAGVTRGETTWYLAEGATGPFFDTYLLIANHESQPADVVVRYLTPVGQAFERRVRVAARSRHTIHVNREPGLSDTAVSMVVTSSLPVVAERSMYWGGGAGSWREAHNAVGTATLGRRIALAEGEVGGPQDAQSYVLVMNPGWNAAQVAVTFLPEYHPPVTVTRTVVPRGRLTVSAAEARLPSGTRFGVLVESTQPVAVERAMYWGVGGETWSGGSCEAGVVIW